jgi:hypothetical protein
VLLARFVRAAVTSTPPMTPPAIAIARLSRRSFQIIVESFFH